MTLEEKFAEMFPEYTVGSVFLSPYWDLFEAGAEIATKELQEDLKHKKIAIQNRKARIKDLEKENAELKKQLDKARDIINCLVHLGEFNENTVEEYLNYQVHDALKQAEQFLSEVEK